MCQALVELMRPEMEAYGDEREAIGETRANEAGIKNIIEICQDFNALYEETCSKIAEKYELTMEHAKDYMDKYWKN